MTWQTDMLAFALGDCLLVNIEPSLALAHETTLQRPQARAAQALLEAHRARRPLIAMASAAQRAASLFPNLMMPAWILPSVTSSTIRLDSAHAATISAATLRLCS